MPEDSRGRSLAQQSRLTDRLRAARKAAGLTQRAVAQRLGVHKVTVSNWERPTGTTPSDADLDRLAGLYGTTPAALRYGVETVEPTSLPGVLAEAAYQQGIREGLRRARAAIEAQLVALPPELVARATTED